MIVVFFIVYSQASYVPVYPSHGADSYVKIIQKPVAIYGEPLEITEGYGYGPGYGYKGDHYVRYSHVSYIYPKKKTKQKFSTK